MPLQPLEAPSRLSGRLSASIRGALLALVFSFFLVVYNIGQLFSLVVRPFSKRAFRAYNRYGANAWWTLVSALIRAVGGHSIVVTGDEPREEENALILANHQRMADIPVLAALAAKNARAGDLKWVVKSSFKYVPGLGWGMLLLDNLFVKRNWTKDRISIEKVFAKIIRDELPFWLVIFPEGTRISQAKLKRSRRIARRQGLEPLNHVMFPLTKGVGATLDGLGQRLEAVYDVTIGYSDGLPGLWRYLCGNVPPTHLHVRRIAAEDVPVEESERAAWIHDVFAGKDARLAFFRERGCFEASVELEEPCSVANQKSVAR